VELFVLWQVFGQRAERPPDQTLLSSARGKPMIATLHRAQCPICGQPMALARIDPHPDLGHADRCTYECAQGHAVTSAVERRSSAAHRAAARPVHEQARSIARG
jgi:hypothetical protein